MKIFLLYATLYTFKAVDFFPHAAMVCIIIVAWHGLYQIARNPKG